MAHNVNRPTDRPTDRLQLQPISWREARSFITRHHRHHQPPQGWLFGIAVNSAERVVGVVTIGRPVARRFQDGYTCEVTRLCSNGTKNVSSMLYAAAWRAARAMGYRRLITYTLPSESGTSLRAAGWRFLHQTRAQSWSRLGRPRVDKHPIGPKLLWEASA